MAENMNTYAVEVDVPGFPIFMVTHRSSAEALTWLHRDKFRDRDTLEANIWLVQGYTPVQAVSEIKYEARSKHVE